MEKVKLNVFVAGRVLAGLYFVFAGANHFIQLDGMASYTAAKGVPLPEAAVILTGIMLLLGGASILTGYRPWAGIAILTLFLVPVTLIMHAFWNVEEAAARTTELVHFTKNLGLLGSLWSLVGVPEPWPVSIEAYLRGRAQTSQPATA